MKRCLTILILDNTFTFGGAINSLKHMLKSLDTGLFKPVLVTGQPKEFLRANLPDTIWYNYVPRLPWVNNRIYRKIAALAPFRIKRLMQILNFCRFCYWVLFITIPEALRYYRIGKRHRVSLVHLNNILGSQLAGIIAAKLLGVPCVAHLRDFEEVHPITRFYARLIDHHIAISEAIKENLLQLGVPETRISVVHDALDLDEFDATVECNHLLRELGLAADRPRFGIFGRVVEWKGIREYLQAARLIVEKVPEVQGFVIGGPSDGDEQFYQEMLQLTADLGIEKEVIFTGYRSDVPALMKLMDVVVHASNRPEPFGMVVIEGMAMGKPVIATRAGGPLDIVADGETGYLVAVGDAEALALKVIDLLRRPDLCLRMGRRGRERVREMFNSRMYSEKMQEIYSAAVMN